MTVQRDQARGTRARWPEELGRQVGHGAASRSEIHIFVCTFSRTLDAKPGNGFIAQVRCNLRAQFERLRLMRYNQCRFSRGVQLMDIVERFEHEMSKLAPTGSARYKGAAWKILVVDDDQEVHEITRLALRDFEFEGRAIEFLAAHSGAESIQIMRAHPDIAVVLMDVVMETERAGLEAVRTIRDELENAIVRIILRTGHPGDAPERTVITHYGINDYKEKTELTATKLFSAIYTALCSYRDLRSLDCSYRALLKVVHGSARLLNPQSLDDFAQLVGSQLRGLMHEAQEGGSSDQADLCIAAQLGDDVRVIAGTGQFDRAAASDTGLLAQRVQDRIHSVMGANHAIFDPEYFAFGLVGPSGCQLVIYLSSCARLQPVERFIVDLYCRNACLALDFRYAAGLGAAPPRDTEFSSA